MVDRDNLFNDDHYLKKKMIKNDVVEINSSKTHGEIKRSISVEMDGQVSKDCKQNYLVLCSLSTDTKIAWEMCRQ